MQRRTPAQRSTCCRPRLIVRSFSTSVARVARVAVGPGRASSGSGRVIVGGRAAGRACVAGTGVRGRAGAGCRGSRRRRPRLRPTRLRRPRRVAGRRVAVRSGIGPVVDEQHPVACLHERAAKPERDVAVPVVGRGSPLQPRVAVGGGVAVLAGLDQPDMRERAASAPRIRPRDSGATTTVGAASGNSPASAGPRPVSSTGSRHQPVRSAYPLPSSARSVLQTKASRRRPASERPSSGFTRGSSRPSCACRTGRARSERATRAVQGASRSARGSGVPVPWRAVDARRSASSRSPCARRACLAVTPVNVAGPVERHGAGLIGRLEVVVLAVVGLRQAKLHGWLWSALRLQGRDDELQVVQAHRIAAGPEHTLTRPPSVIRMPLRASTDSGTYPLGCRGCR
jgi:hypothetical protein